MSPEALARMLRPLWRKVRLAAGKGVINLVNDALKVQGIQVTLLNSETAANLQRFQEYGFTSNPMPGAEFVGVSICGVRGNMVIIATDDGRYRPTGLQPGEVEVYTKFGDYMKLDQDSNITINAGNNVNINATSKVTVTAPAAEFTGDVKIDGKLAVAKKATFGSSASFSGAGKNVTVAATVNLLVITPGTLKIAGVPVVAP